MNLAQVYEAEFAPLTGVLPDADGCFQTHTTQARDGSFGYLLYHEGLPAGFGVFRHTGPTLLVQELFVCPHLRRKGMAGEFLRLIAQRHGGIWDIRQLEEAHEARAFWRAWAKRVDPEHAEDALEDPKWGRVTRQLVDVSRLGKD